VLTSAFVRCHGLRLQSEARLPGRSSCQPQARSGLKRGQRRQTKASTRALRPGRQGLGCRMDGPLNNQPAADPRLGQASTDKAGVVKMPRALRAHQQHGIPNGAHLSI